jgi:hypothetical protein
MQYFDFFLYSTLEISTFYSLLTCIQRRMDPQFREIYRCNIFIILPYMEAYYHKYFLHGQFSVEWGRGGNPSHRVHTGVG